MITRIPIRTCEICKCQFARSYRVVIRGKVIIRFDNRSRYCSNACRQKAYRNNLILKRRLNVTQYRLNITTA